MKSAMLYVVPVIIFLLPPLATIILYKISHHLFRDQWRAIHFAAEASAILYIAIVMFLLQKYVHVHMVGYISIGLLTLLSVVLIIQWKQQSDVMLGKGLKVLMRFSFLVFGFSYILMLFYALFQVFFT